jgi:hypothetical protein
MFQLWLEIQKYNFNFLRRKCQKAGGKEKGAVSFEYIYRVR